MEHALHTLEHLLKREADGAKGAVRRTRTLFRSHLQANPCWFMWVPTCFNVALDIQQTTRAFHECPRCTKVLKGETCPTCKKTIHRITVKKCGPCGECSACKNGEPCLHPRHCDICPTCGKCKICRYCPDCRRYEVLEWTQGSGFNFSPGDTFYDSPHAFEGVWSDALKNFQYCIEVIRATPATPAKLPPKTAKEETADETEGGTHPRYPGRVEFKLFVPNSDKMALILREIFDMTQDEFIQLLISGNSPKLKLKWSDTLL